MSQSLPLHIKITELLTREIAAGHWHTGDRLPPEAVLATHLGCAVGTLRKALTQLAEQGLLERKHGSGNYVKRAPDGKGLYDFFRLALHQGQGLPTAQILAFETIDHPSDVPTFSQDSHACYRLRRLRFLNSVPIALEEIFFDTRHNQHLKAEDLGEAQYYFYQTKLGFWIANAQDKVSISAVPDWTVSAFDSPANTPCGYIERLSYSGAQALEEFSRTWFNPHLAHYVGRLH